MKEEKIRLEGLIEDDRDEFEYIREKLSNQNLEEEDRERFVKLVEEYDGLINGLKSRSMVTGSHSERLAKMEELVRQLRQNLARLEEVEGRLENLSQNNRDERKYRFDLPRLNNKEVFIEFAGDESSDSYRLEVIDRELSKKVYEDLEVVDYRHGYRDIRALVIKDEGLAKAIGDDLARSVRNNRLNLYDSKNNFIELGMSYGSFSSMDEDDFEDLGNQPILDVMTTSTKSSEYNRVSVTIVAMNISPDAELGARLYNEDKKLIAESHKIIDRREYERNGKKQYSFDIGLELDEAHLIEKKDYYIYALIDGVEHEIIVQRPGGSPTRPSFNFSNRYMFTGTRRKKSDSKDHRELIFEGCNIVDNGPYSLLITDKEFDIKKEYTDLEAVKNPDYHTVGLEVDLSDLNRDDWPAKELYYVIIDGNGDIKKQLILG